MCPCMDCREFQSVIYGNHMYINNLNGISLIWLDLYRHCLDQQISALERIACCVLTRDTRCSVEIELIMYDTAFG